MIFWIEALVLCVLFTLAVVPFLKRDPVSWISSYPPAIQQRARELGLVPAGQTKMPPAVLARKIIACLLAAVLFALILFYINGVRGFVSGFLYSYGLWLVVDWYDALVIDCLWFCRSKKVRSLLPGTEDMTEAYQDYFFHVKCSMIGMLLGLPACLLTGLFVFLLEHI